MPLSRLAALALISLNFGQTALAQSSGLVLPAEFPPASYTGNQYIDSAGCAFIRAGISGTVTWVPRVNRDRSQLCGFQPSLANAATVAIAANAAAVAAAPVIRIDTPPPSAIATAAADPTDIGIPINTVATLTTLPAPMVSAVASPQIISLPAAPEVAPAVTLTRAEACAGRTGIQLGYVSSLTGLPLDCGGLTAVSEPAPSVQPLRMTMAQICADMDATGQRYMHAATGIPVRCGPQVESPSGLTAPFAGVAVARTGDVPALNGVSVSQTVRLAAAVGPPPGYEPVWNDGRLNPNRGLPEGNAQAVAQNASSVSLSAMNLPQPVAVGHRYVQVGTFGDLANADRAAARLQALGLTVGFATITRNGAQLRIVAVGPFDDAGALQAALQATQSAGFSDAFTRN